MTDTTTDQAAVDAALRKAEIERDATETQKALAAEQMRRDANAALARDDAAIETAAVALCWDSGLVIMNGSDVTPMKWWSFQSKDERRRYRRAARVVCEAREAYHAAIEKQE